jgi:hypothetical protein
MEAKDENVQDGKTEELDAKGVPKVKYDWQPITNDFFSAIKELKLGELMQGNFYGEFLNLVPAFDE